MEGAEQVGESVAVDTADESKRISLQITSMSTQLMESIQNQSLLEEKLNRANKAAAALKEQTVHYDELKGRVAKLEASLTNRDEEMAALKSALAEEKSKRAASDKSVEELQSEVEDLTASLFSEANNMVADARKEKHTTEILNRKLLEAVNEKDNALETMKIQLKHLRKMLEKVDVGSPSATGRSSMTSADTDTNSLKGIVTRSSNQSQSDTAPLVVYSPSVGSVRYDLSLYSEFLKFLVSLPRCTQIRDTESESKLVRRLINDEIAPILRIDSAPGIGWMAKKSLMNVMLEGMVIIEPNSGVNENYQHGHSSPSISQHSLGKSQPHLFSYPADSPPIASFESCALCGESRSDIYEHERLHKMKIQQKRDDGTLEVVNLYPLCLWCLLRVRQTCEIFSFLRSLKTGVWGLETIKTRGSPTSAKSKKFDLNNAPIRRNKTKNSANRTKRMSWMAGLGLNTPTSSSSAPNDVSLMEPSTTFTDKNGLPNTNIKRAWLQLCKLRSILHWAHIGIWSVSDALDLKIGPITTDPDDAEDDYSQSSFMNLNLNSNNDSSEGQPRNSIPPTAQSLVIAEESGKLAEESAVNSVNSPAVKEERANEELELDAKPGDGQLETTKTNESDDVIGSYAEEVQSPVDEAHPDSSTSNDNFDDAKENI
ncbi:guanine nucleotide exchange factor SEC2 KNAG_0F00460 [Huiozyma naganishii CBS 8797]|uniref:GDP/GTP exchange factor Sec2 N-terminal domain-containing protein n=1 Tax=Huiozyma naganishii (strain ATCC MYA-139 / BCRC 22969 / CBS 8797 / KCTC 17520 / NBRC 10181 / NCYC 3082 / Yp74L-3) TaxID=1071383 RepID=J7R775_HUIN7|nr:hypothetical protein KNAG_0F00460 [Kazachstania naganishii CBS 8797]CCK70715.1 hypothetical protein KNAG_0F00460 [Kazachstania naganishii CBS 8797]